VQGMRVYRWETDTQHNLGNHTLVKASKGNIAQRVHRLYRVYRYYTTTTCRILLQPALRQILRINLAQEHIRVLAARQDYRKTLALPHSFARFGSLQDSLIGSLGWKSTAPTLPLCPPNLYRILPLSTSQMVTVRSPPPAATRAPLSVFDQEHFVRICSNPAGAP
jgi:hypothetical protein